jgi:isopropylmalate/homocitrate/citramalate synthase
MAAPDGEHVKVREVGPRDGFQNEPEVIPTDDKVRLVEMLARTGIQRLGTRCGCATASRR